jgi:WD40 repeat protein
VSQSKGGIRVTGVRADGKALTLEGHSGQVTALAFSADGKTLASGGDDRLVYVWDLKSGDPVLELRGHNREVTHVAFSPDGRRLVSTSGDLEKGSVRPGDARLWDLATGRECLTLGAGADRVFGGAAFSPDGRRLYAAATRLPARPGAPSPGVVLVWDASPPLPSATRDADVHSPAGKRAPVLEVTGFNSAIRSLRYGPKRDRLAVAGDRDELSIVDAGRGRVVKRLAGHRGPPIGLAFSPDGTRLVSFATLTYIEGKVWDLQTGNEIQAISKFTGSWPLGGGFSPDGTRIFIAGNKQVSAGNARVTVHDLGTTQAGSGGFILSGHAGQLADAAFSPDGDYLATLSVTIGPDGSQIPAELKIWETKTGRALHTITGLKLPVWGLAFSADSRSLGAALGRRERDKTFTPIQAVKIWNVQTGLEGPPLDKVQGLWLPFALGADGKQFAAAEVATLGIRIVDASTGQTVRTLPDNRLITALAFSPDGKELAAGDMSPSLRLWDLTASDYPGFAPVARKSTSLPIGVMPAAPRLGPMVQARTGEFQLFEGHEGGVSHAFFSPDGAYVVSHSLDRTARLWDAQAGREIAQLESERDAQSPANFLASAFTEGSKQYLLLSVVMRPLAGQRRHERSVELRTWDLPAGKPAGPRIKFSPQIQKAVFAPGGRWFATWMFGRHPLPVQVWEVGKNFPVAALAAGQPLLFLSGDGSLLGQGDGPGIKVWDVRAQKELLALRPAGMEKPSLLGAGLSADGKRILAVFIETGNKRPPPRFGPKPARPPKRVDAVLKVWSVPDGKELRSLGLSFEKFKPAYGQYAAAFSTDGNVAAVGSTENVLIFDAWTGRELQYFKIPGYASKLHFSPDARRLAIGSFRQSVVVWELKGP